MNKRLYRIVFNKARGMLMVVSELARSCSGSASSCGIGRSLQRLVCRVGTLSLALWLASGAITVQAAGIVADASAPGKQQPTVISTANGTTQVNIQTPSAGGVSRNTFSRFDVGQDGAILNNSHKNTSTQLGGMVTANPWLVKGEAKVILNEVNARNPSQLNGYIEVAGQKADVVIASPSGITCNGCGFINAGRATLTTGTSQMQDGRITGYQVERGDITVNGSGLDSTGQEHTDIIARAVQVNAAIHAQDLRVTTGHNTVDAAHEQVTVLAGNDAAKPVLALDVSQVGGMYAGKIRLLGTEKGVGVRNAGSIGAQAGTVTLSADGRIENSGAVWASTDTTLSSTASVQNSGSIAAEHNVSLTGTDIVSTGTLGSGVQPDGRTGSSGDLTLSASGKLEMHGVNAAGGNITATGRGLDASGSVTQGNTITLNAGQGDLSTHSAQIVARDTLRATTAGTLNNKGGLLAADQLTLTAKRLQNQKGQISQSGTRELTLNHQDGIDNREGSIAANATVTVNAASLDNRQGQIIAADTGTLTIKTAGLTDNRKGELAAAGSISVAADGLDNSGGFISAEKGRIGLTSSKALTNIGGTIAAHEALTLDSIGLNNDEGLIQSGADMFVDTHGSSISNKDNLTAGGIVSFGTLHVNAGSINNQHGMLAGAKETAIWAKDVDSGDSAEGTTRAAIESGTLVVRDKAHQAQDVADLSRDTAHANGSIDAIFDREKEQRRMEEAQLVGDIGSQVADITRTQGELNALEEARRVHPEMTTGQLKETQAYRDAQAEYGTGSDMQRAIQAATAAAQGLSGGDISAALAGAAAPYVAEIIGHRSGLDETMEKAAAHAVANAVLAAMQGKDTLAGTAGAAAGELAGSIALEMYGKDVTALSESEKQTISALATLAAGIAGGVAGDGTASAIDGAQAGKTVVENNYLNSKQIYAWSAEMKSCQANGGDCKSIIKKYEELSTSQQQQLISDCAANPTTCQQKYGDVLTDSLAVKQAIDRALGEDIPLKMVYNLTATFAQQMQAEGVVATQKVSEALQKEYGLDEVQAGILASTAASAFGGVSKAGRGSPLPTPTATSAKNGLNYQSNPKHTPGQQGYSFNAGTEPKNSIDLFGTSVVGGKKRYAIDAEGNVHQFTNANDGTWHWSGSTGDKTVPLKKSDVPNSVKKELGLPGKWR